MQPQPRTSPAQRPRRPKSIAANPG